MTPPLRPAEDWSCGQGRKGGLEGVRLREAGKRRKGPRDRRKLGTTWTCMQVKSGKGGQPHGGRKAHARAKNRLGRMTGEGSTDERLRLKGGGVVNMDVCSATGQEGGGGEKRR